MKKIRIAQIGVNEWSHGRDVFITLKKHPELFEIVGYAIVENERETCAWKLKEFEGYKEMTVEEILSDPTIDAVIVETDEVDLTKYALMVAKAGKHMHMEKPGGIDKAMFEELVAEVKKHNTVFHLGYMYRYNPYVIEIMEKVKNKEFGEIISVNAQMSCSHGAQLRNWLGNFPGGMTFYLGCHLVDLVLQIKGKPDNIIPLNRCSGVNVESAQDFGMAVFEYPNGISTIKTCACEEGGYARRQLVVCGTKKTVELKPFEMREPDAPDFEIYTVKREFECGEGWSNWFNLGVETKSPYFDRYEDMMIAFHSYVVGEKQNPYTYDYELELYNTLLKCCGK